MKNETKVVFCANDLLVQKRFYWDEDSNKDVAYYQVELGEELLSSESTELMALQESAVILEDYLDSVKARIKELKSGNYVSGR